MELYFTPTSPYARKVRIALIERGLADRVAERPVNPLEDPPAFHTLAPFGKVPVLVDDGDRSLFDSRVIGAFLDQLDAPGPRLRPVEPHAALDDMRLEALADGILDCAVPVVIERRRPAGERSRDFERRQVGKMRRGLEALAIDPPKAPAPREAPTFGLIAAGCALRYLGFRLGDETALALPDTLVPVHEALEARDSFQATAPPAG
jgi:glutathione S-transferase